MFNQDESNAATFQDLFDVTKPSWFLFVSANKPTNSHRRLPSNLAQSVVVFRLLQRPLCLKFTSFTINFSTEGLNMSIRNAPNMKTRLKAGVTSDGTFFSTFCHMIRNEHLQTVDAKNTYNNTTNETSEKTIDHGSPLLPGLLFPLPPLVLVSLDMRKHEPANALPMCEKVIL